MLTPEPLAPPARTDRVAVAALVSGVLGLAPVAVVLGAVGLARTKNPEVGGRRLALAGLVLGVLWSVGLVAVLVFALLLGNRFVSSVQDLTAPGADAGVADGAAKSASEIESGDCLLAWDPAAATGDIDPDVVVLDCSVPHRAQAFGEVDLSDGYPDAAPYPGAQALVGKGTAACRGQLPTNVDTTRAPSLDVSSVPPPSAGWAQGSRTVTCLAVATTTDLTTSVTL